MTIPFEASGRETVSDEALVAAAGKGDVAAFEELYRRHRDVATRLAERVTGNEDDAREATAEAFTNVFGVVSTRGLRRRGSFRSYLLTAVRHVAIDKVRQRGHVEPTDEIEAYEVVSPRWGPADSVVRSEDERFLLEAFKGLPQRSRSVLWLVDVERVSAEEAGETLGLTANNVAQIAVRARGHLRHGYVRAHVSGDVEVPCRFTVDRMGPYVEGRLSPPAAAKIEGHLSGCALCQSRLEQLRSVGVVTRRSILPVLVLRRLTAIFRRPKKSGSSGVVPPETFGAQPSALGSHLAAVAGNSTVVDVVQTLGQSPALQRVVACVAAGTMTIGASSLVYRTHTDSDAAAQPTVSAALPLASPSVATQEPGLHPAGLQAAAVGPGVPVSPAAPGPATGSVAPRSGDASVVGTLQPLATPLVVLVSPTSAGAGSGGPALNVPPVSAPPLATPPLSVPPVSTPLPPVGTPPVSIP
ncbi:MAG: sigma-70 family RNA polymerase sigma factor, partial [Actinomycetota bacterium]|nr:sigma-70 family RNA polymerase sigma factor [Actinomycetota bacterium]